MTDRLAQDLQAHEGLGALLEALRGQESSNSDQSEVPEIFGPMRPSEPIR